MKKKVEEGYPHPPVVVMVSPEMATKWLEGNTHNRQLHQGTIEKYARDMKLSRWRLTHQGLAFTADGKLIDGQHRLWAVIESGKTVPMLVHHGLPIESQAVIDTHRGRSSMDRLSLSDKFGAVNNAEASTLKWVVKGVGQWPRMTCEEEQEHFARHREAIRFAINAFPGKKARVTTSAVYGVIARAFYSKEDREMIVRFCHALFSGERQHDWERSAILLRDALVSATPGTSSMMKPQAAYLKCSNALRHFLDKHVILRLYPATEELFLLPEERGRTKISAPKSTKRYDTMDRILAHVRETGGATAREISAATGIALTNVQGTVARAVMVGLLHAESESRKGKAGGKMNRYVPILSGK